MIEFQLFLGFSVDNECSLALNATNPYIIETFIDNASEYLHEITHEGIRYIGKLLGAIESYANLELLEANIYSLLTKLSSSYNFKEKPLILFATERI